MEIYLVRHTETIAEKGMCYGQSDIKIKIPFKKEFELIKSKLPDKKAFFYSSTLMRCTQLASYLSNDEYNINKLLLEVNFGNWENKQWDSIEANELNPWMEDFVNQVPPNGESFKNLDKRINDFIRHLLSQEENKPIVIITHAGVIRCFICYVLDLPLQSAFKIPIDLGSVTKINLNKNSNFNKLIFLNQ